MDKLKRNLFLKNRANKGYMLISTLSLLILSGIFFQGAIQISANQLIQLKQFSSAYEAKTALNMSEELLKDYIFKNNGSLPKEGKINTSIGRIIIKKESKNSYQMTLTLQNSIQFHKEFEVDEEIIKKAEESETKNNKKKKGENNKNIKKETEQEKELEQEKGEKEELEDKEE